MLEEYITRVKRLNANDLINAENFNGCLDEMQHNLDILFNKINSNGIVWSASEKIFGNMMDIDAAGQRRFTNGGKLDSQEKIATFASSTGATSYENYSLNDDEDFLRLDVDAGESVITLTRNIPVPDSIRHQNVVVGFKTNITSISGEMNERWDVYVNDVLAGSGDTMSISGGPEGTPVNKSVYGVYYSTGNENNMEVKFVRSVTNGVTPAQYVARISKIYMGLNSTNMTENALNYSSTYDTVMVDDFFDFENNSIVPIPSFVTRKLDTTDDSIDTNTVAIADNTSLIYEISGQLP